MIFYFELIMQKDEIKISAVKLKKKIKQCARVVKKKNSYKKELKLN